MIFLTEDNYYSPEANWDYMSVSQFKDFLQCESMAMAKLTGEYKEPPSDAMLVGSYVDAWCEGTLPEFIEAHPEIFNSKSKGEKVLKADFKIAENIISLIQSDEDLSYFLSGQKQVIMTAPLYGAMWKIKMDSYIPDVVIADWKIMKSLTDRFWLQDLRRYGSFVENYKYNVQLNVYAMVEAIATGRDELLDRRLVVCTKQDPPKRAILNGFDEDLAYTHWLLERYMPHILQVKSGEIDASGCGDCPVCRKQDKTVRMNYKYLIG